MPAGALFDRVVVVDWSAASTPRRGRDSIWVATVDAGGTSVRNLATRHDGERVLHALLDDRAARTLLGVDFSLGYPAGTATRLGLAGSPWRETWALLESAVVDDRRNGNNRFAVAADLNSRFGDGVGPFWGRPGGNRFDSLTTTKVAVPGVPEWRAVEDALRGGGRRPASIWQLLGAGCVGSQSLVGIPVLERLRRAAGGRLHVWPFTTGLAVPAVGRGELVVAEVWPTLVADDVDALLDGGRTDVRDAAQVESLAAWFSGLDRAGRLAALFEPDVHGEVAASVVAEEGWVLGVRSAVGGRREGAAATAAGR